MSTAAVDPSPVLDVRMTMDRNETKFLVPLEPAGWLSSRIGNRLPRHRFTGEGANRLPGAWHLVTTIYFDTPSRTHYRAAIGSPESSGARARARSPSGTDTSPVRQLPASPQTGGSPASADARPAIATTAIDRARDGPEDRSLENRLTFSVPRVFLPGRKRSR